MLVGTEMEIKDDLTWNPPLGARAESGGKYLVKHNITNFNKTRLNYLNVKAKLG